MIHTHISVPTPFAAAVVRMLNEHPTEHPDHPGLTSLRAMVATEGCSQFTLIRIEWPDRKPTIPELIAKWHAEPTAENRLALWSALVKLPRRSHECGSAIYQAYASGDCPILVS